MQKKSLIEAEQETVFKEQEQYNILPPHAPYTIFQKDILRRHILKIPSETIYDLEEGWEEKSVGGAGIINLPARIDKVEYEKIFSISVEQESLYYLQLETTGSSFEVRLNHQLIGIGNGTQRVYEIPITVLLKEKENRVSIQFEEKENILFLGAKLLKRPQNHIFDYQISMKFQKEKIYMEIQAIYSGSIIPTKCLIISPKGKNVKKENLDENGKVSLEIRRKDVTLWNDETHLLYSLVFITAEEVIAEKMPIENVWFEDGCYYMDSTAIPLRMLNLKSEISGSLDALLKEELIEKMKMWKKRNFNAVYVEESMDSIYLKKMCSEFGFYYIRSFDGFSMNYRKELLLTEDGKWERMPRVYLPLKVWAIENNSGVLAMKSEMLFQNLKDVYYIRVGVYQNGKRIGQKLKYILDFEPGVIETFRPEWVSQLEGEIVIKIEFYQRFKTDLIEKQYYYGSMKVNIHK